MGDARQVHLARWERYLSGNGYEVLTVSLEMPVAMAGRCEHLYVPGALPDFVRYTAAVPALRRIIRRFHPDIVNAHFLPNYGTMAMLSGFHPWILSTWGSDIMLVPETSPLHMLRTRRVLRSADYITSDADVMTRRIVELGADPGRVVTFPFGIDREVFHPTDTNGAEGPRIISNRKLEKVYSIDTIIAAFPAVLREEPSATLTIAGQGTLENPLRGAAARVATSAAIRFVGAVSHDRMAPLLREHDLYVSMSLSDTTSVSLLEAMACGLFPIVSDIPANREWIEHGANGLLVPTRDTRGLSQAMLEAWRSPPLRREAAQRNRAIIAERADWGQNMAVVGELLGRALRT